MTKFVLGEQHRKFAREVGSIVLGVLIALAIGEIAEAVRWKVRVDSSMTAMTQELEENHYIFVERRFQQPCIENRLKALKLILADARKTGTLPDVQNIGGLGARLLQNAAFEVSNSEGVPLHMDRAKARSLAEIYFAGDAYAGFTDREREHWATLYLLENAAGPVDGELLGTFLQAWAGAAEQGTWAGIVAEQVDDQLTAAGISVKFDAEFPDRKALVQRMQDLPICGPLLVDGKPFQPATAL